MKRILIILLIIAYLLFSILIIYKNEKDDILALFGGIYNAQKNEKKIYKKLSDESPYYDKYILINEDYVGHLVFDSGLIEKPVVQAKSCYKKDGSPYRFFEEDGTIAIDFSNHTGNDVYLWMDYQTMEYDYFETGGSIFMDCRNNMNDQNFIIYGHYFPNYESDPERIKGFTPLEKLLTKEGYDNNKYVSLYFQNQKYDYELAAVFYYDDQDIYYQYNCPFYRPNYNYDDDNDIYDSNFCLNYFNSINYIKLYDTDIMLSPNDRTLTFQTCTAYKDVYEICVFKLMNISNY